MKTMAIRLSDEISAQLTLIAQLENTSVAELIRQAIDALLTTKREQDGLAAKAEAALAEIEAESAARRAAIQAMLKPSGGGSSATEAPTTEPPSGGASGRGRSRRS